MMAVVCVFTLIYSFFNSREVGEVVFEVHPDAASSFNLYIDSKPQWLEGLAVCQVAGTDLWEIKVSLLTIDATNRMEAAIDGLKKWNDDFRSEHKKSCLVIIFHKGADNCYPMS